MIDAQPDRLAMARLFVLLLDFRTFRERFRREIPRVVLPWVKERIRRRILKDKHGPDGEPWPPWSIDYYSRRRRLRGGMLVGRTRKLVNSFRAVYSSGKGELGTSVAYAAIHHFGGTAGNGAKIPARPYFGIGTRDIGELEDVIQQWVNGTQPK